MRTVPHNLSDEQTNMPNLSEPFLNYKNNNYVLNLLPYHQERKQKIKVFTFKLQYFFRHKVRNEVNICTLNGAQNYQGYTKSA